jgi:hypothetical protein
MDWEQFAEEVIELGAGKRTVEEMSFSEDDLMELQIWAATVDYLYQVKLDLVMFFGKEPGITKEKIMYYMDHLDEAEEYVNNFMIERNIPRPWLDEEDL